MAQELVYLEVDESYRPKAEKLQVLFKKNLDLSDEVIYTIVPRGLIISIDERYFFNEGSAKIRQSSLLTLRTISKLLKSIPNRCVLEDHSEDGDLSASEYDTIWELSIARASNLVNYIIMCENLPWIKIFPLGYGEIMPFKGNVDPKATMDNRVDFVIIEYDTSR